MLMSIFYITSNFVRKSLCITCLSIFVLCAVVQTSHSKTLEDPSAQSISEIKTRANEGSASHQYYLGTLYDYGFSNEVPTNTTKAAYWYDKAANQGYWKAQFALGGLYFTGDGVPQDNELGLSIFKKLADQGYAQVQFGLGYRYLEGHGVSQDIVEGVELMRKAAEGWHTGAQYRLSQMYKNGQNVEQNNILAYKWLSIASEGGLEIAEQDLSELNKVITDKEKEEASRLVESWMVNHPKVILDLLP